MNQMGMVLNEGRMSMQQHGSSTTVRLEDPPRPDPLRPDPEQKRKRRSNDPTKPEPRHDKPSPENPHDPQDLPSQELSNSGKE